MSTNGPRVLDFGKPHVHALPVYLPPSVDATRYARLNSNENPLGPSPRAVQALHEAASAVHLYPDAKASTLRAALAERFGVEPDAVACCNGSDEMIALLTQALLSASENLVMSEGSFVTFGVRAAAAGARVVRVPMRDYRHDLDAMAAAVDEKTRVVVVCNPSNPTGSVDERPEFARFLQRVPDRVVVVVDEAYAEFVDDSVEYPDSCAELRARRQNLLVLRTFAKAYGLAGLRIGYSLAAPPLLAYLEKLRPIFSVNALAQAAAFGALGDEAHLAASVEYAQSWRKRFQRELSRCGYRPVQSQANFVLVPVADERATTALLREHRLQVTPLAAWGLENHVRISFGSPAENQALLSVLVAHAAEQHG